MRVCLILTLIFLAFSAQAKEPGLYLRLAKNERENRAEFFLAHPLVDAVVAGFDWGSLEPEEGEYNFSEIDSLLAKCKKYKKGLVIHIVTYGQDPGHEITPNWLYEKGVDKISFNGGGVAKGAEVSAPKVWDKKYLEEYEKLIAVFATRYDGDPNIWYIVPGVGHIGNINAQPSKGGGAAFRKAGWTPELWHDFTLDVVGLYQKHFSRTPLLVLTASKMIDDKKHQDYRAELRDLLLKLGKKGISVISLGLEPDINKIKKNEIIAQIEPLVSLEKIQIGLGDDWPLWVPTKRRQEKFLADRDDAGLKKELDYAFGGTEGLPETHISILYVLHPEIEASHPNAKNGQNKTVYKLLEIARNRLKSQ